MEKSEERKSGSSHVANKKSSLRTVGEFLREARQGRNLSVEDLSSSLRIGKEQLIALESGDESALPEKVFIRAMVRRIAEKLNLDTSFILEELNEKKKNEPKPSPVIKKKNTRKNKGCILTIIKARDKLSFRNKRLYKAFRMKLIPKRFLIGKK